jgi:hypothetical protein
MRTERCAPLAALALLLCLAAPGQAEPASETPPGGDSAAPATEAPPPARPWAEGVSEADQAEAQAIFERANRHFVEKAYNEAIAGYRLALERWPHPAIEYNLAVCLLEIDERVAALESMERALRFGRAPHTDEAYENAKRYVELLRGSLAVVIVRSDVDGATITLDGQPAFESPGEVRRILEPGQHVAVAEKPGFVTTTRSFDAPAGRETTIELDVEPFTRVKTVYPMPRALPWIVAGTGVAIGVAAFPVRLLAQDEYDQYDAIVAESCPRGCAEGELPGAATDAESRGDAYEVASVAMFAVGAVTALTGAALLFFNTPESVQVPVTVDPGGVQVRF